MSPKHLALSLTVLAAVAFLAIPAGASNVPRMGDQRVGLFQCAFAPPCGEVSLTANEAFSVAHGFSNEPIEDLLNPLHRFELRVDGVERHGAIDLELQGEGSRTYVFNFPQGLDGTHAFTGCWYGTDGALVACGTRIVHFG
jgi:hypothetical protein